MAKKTGFSAAKKTAKKEQILDIVTPEVEKEVIEEIEIEVEPAATVTTVDMDFEVEDITNVAPEADPEADPEANIDETLVQEELDDELKKAEEEVDNEVEPEPEPEPGPKIEKPVNNFINIRYVPPTPVKGEEEGNVKLARNGRDPSANIPKYPKD